MHWNRIDEEIQRETEQAIDSTDSVFPASEPLSEELYHRANISGKPEAHMLARFELLFLPCGSGILPNRRYATISRRRKAEYQFIRDRVLAYYRDDIRSLHLWICMPDGPVAGLDIQDKDPEAETAF